jgi:hypothetical protein
MGAPRGDEPESFAAEAGEKEEARQMLGGIYGRFTEGFDTADLKEAQALLESFGSRS